MLSIVVPTFNERDNVARIVKRIDAALSEAAVEVIFVDDSDDDTPAIIAGLAARFPITLLHREPEQRSGGLGTALAMGLEHAAGRYICVLDGDLQHPPEKLPELLAAAQSADADVVVGSRYRPGGSARTLPWSRKIVSFSSKWISKILFHEKLWQTSDPGSGFFLISRRVLRGVRLRPVGYKMLTEVLMRGSWSRLVEVPYEFQNREAGTSKATLRQGALYAQHTVRLFREVADAARFWKFLMVGASGVGVNLGVLWLVAVAAGGPAWLGWAAGVEASIVTNFLLNRSVTWRDRAESGSRAVAEGARYHVASLAGVAANALGFAVLIAIGLPLLLAGTAGIGAGVTTNFLGARAWVFKARSAQPELRLVERGAPAAGAEKPAAVPEQRAA